MLHYVHSSTANRLVPSLSYDMYQSNQYLSPKEGTNLLPPDDSSEDVHK